MEQVSMNTPLDSLSNAINDLEYHLKYSSYKIAPEMQERILRVGTKFREYVAGKQTSTMPNNSGNNVQDSEQVLHEAYLELADNHTEKCLEVERLLRTNEQLGHNIIELQDALKIAITEMEDCARVFFAKEFKIENYEALNKIKGVLKDIKK